MLVGIPLLLAMGVFAALVLHIAFAVPALSSTGPLLFWFFVQFGLSVPMYWIQRQFKKNQDLRPALFLFEAYCLGAISRNILCSSFSHRS
jgi:hypothetical protein